MTLWQAPPGWYPDPNAPNTTLRMWSGTEWTDARKPLQHELEPAQNSHSAALGHEELRQPSHMSTGFWLAALVPFAGFIYGIYHARDGGEKIIAASLAWGLFWTFFWYAMTSSS